MIWLFASFRCIVYLLPDALVSRHSQDAEVEVAARGGGGEGGRLSSRGVSYLMSAGNVSC